MPLIVMQAARPEQVRQRDPDSPDENQRMFIRVLRHPLPCSVTTVCCPNGNNANSPILNACSPNGMPMIVRHSTNPPMKYSTAIANPQTPAR